MRLLAPLLALALALPASAQAPRAIRLYIGPVPNPDGVVAPMPAALADSYADLRKAHDKAAAPGIEVVDDPRQADAILTITFRGDVDDSTLSTAVPPLASDVIVSSVPQYIRTLRARVTVVATREGLDLTGVEPGKRRMRWSTQAERINAQASAWLLANRERLVELRKQ